MCRMAAPSLEGLRLVAAGEALHSSDALEGRATRTAEQQTALVAAKAVARTGQRLAWLGDAWLDVELLLELKDIFPRALGRELLDVMGLLVWKASFARFALPCLLPACQCWLCLPAACAAQQSML